MLAKQELFDFINKCDGRTSHYANWHLDSNDEQCDMKAWEKADFVFKEFEKYALEYYKLPYPIIPVQRFLKIKNSNDIKRKQVHIHGNILFDKYASSAYDLSYAVPSKRKEYANIMEALNDNPNSIVMEENKENSFFKYFEEYDIIVGFVLRPTLEKSDYPYYLRELIFIKRDFYIDPYKSVDAINLELCGKNHYAIHNYGISIDARKSIFNNAACQYNRSFMRAASKMYKEDLFMNNMGCAYDYRFFVKYENKAEPKITKDLSYFLSKSLPQIELKKINQVLKNRDRKDLKSYLIIASVNGIGNGECVLRYTIYCPYTKRCQDIVRIYCKGQKVVGCKYVGNGQFTHINLKSLHIKNFKADYMIDIDPEQVKGTIFAYFINILNELNVRDRATLALSIIKLPKLEQLCKIGLAEQVVGTCKEDMQSFNDPKVFNINENNALKFLGLNRYQVDLLSQTSSGMKAFRILEKMKLFIGNVKNQTNLKGIFEKDLSYIDNETSDNLFKFFTYADRTCVDLNRLKSSLVSFNNPDISKNFIQIVIPKINYCIESGTWSRCAMTTYIDYLDILRRLELVSEFGILFDEHDLEDLENKHEQVTDIYNLRVNEFNRKNFDKNIQRIAKLEYSPKDSELCIVTPKCPEDVAKEGIELHHCVKSYIPRISAGTTNIVFIRSKEDVDKPYYTVEVDNDGIIQQVHGFGNCQADNNVLNFVAAWANKKNLTIGRITQIR